MENSRGHTQVRALLGEEYPAVLERLRALLERGASAPELLDALTPAVVNALERERRSRRHAVQAKGIADAKARGVRLGRARKEPPENFRYILDLLEQKKINVEQAAPAAYRPFTG